MDADKFAKVLAMVDSDHHGEALSALRMARNMLAREGMSWRDLAGTVRVSAWPAHGPLVPESPPDTPEDDDEDMLDEAAWRQHTAPIHETAASAEASADYDQRLGEEAARRVELEQLIYQQKQDIRSLYRQLERQQRATAKQRDETERWRKLARDTAEQLWDMGRALEQQAIAPPRRVADRWPLLLDYLRDPMRAHLPDREIARRVGVAVHMVALWRRRLRQGTLRRLRSGLTHHTR